MKTRRSPLSTAIRTLAACVLLAVAGCGSSTIYHASPGEDGPSGSNVITAADIARYPSAVSVEEIIDRHTPGIWLRRRHEPGGAISVDMSGLGTPLFVIDGVPLEHAGGNIGINPQDIATIEIWKHGARTSLYGLRGANGVVLIRTKRTEE